MRTFHITYHNGETKVEQHAESSFTVHLPEKELHLEMKQDNEGANHWFEQQRDNETEETRKIGQAIEHYLAKDNG